tara:strand:- start:141 stop:623 length:483 start_codon:yes stop_codon:yes gene_type:complete
VVDLNDKTVATNRKARHEYDILDTWEAGLVLQGSEVKSLRESKVQIAESYVRSEGPELWLIGLHINPYSKTGNLATGHEPDQPRKLLLHRKEINQIIDRIDRDGLTVIPLKLYFSKGRAKIEIALARGRRLHDKRQAIAKRESQRETERSLVRNQKNRNQ